MRQSPWVQALQAEVNEKRSPNSEESHNAILRETGIAPMLPTYDPPVNYLSGPVNIPPAVMAVMATADDLPPQRQVSGRCGGLANAPV